MDQGRFHLTRQLDWPENLIPICQPAHSPELNPIERLWEYIKAQLRWQNCLSIDDLRQQVYATLAQMTPSLIASLTSWGKTNQGVTKCQIDNFA
jgi:transposase